MVLTSARAAFLRHQFQVALSRIDAELARVGVPSDVRSKLAGCNRDGPGSGALEADRQRGAAREGRGRARVEDRTDVDGAEQRFALHFRDGWIVGPGFHAVACVVRIRYRPVVLGPSRCRNHKTTGKTRR